MISFSKPSLAQISEEKPAIIATSLRRWYCACFTDSVFSLNVTEIYIQLDMAFSSTRIENHFDYSAGNGCYPFCTQHCGPFWSTLHIAALVNAQNIELRVFYCLRSCFWQLKFEKFEVHGEDVNSFFLVLLFVSIIRPLRLNFTAAFHRGK